jgi:hypothetical protein
MWHGCGCGWWWWWWWLCGCDMDWCSDLCLMMGFDKKFLMVSIHTKWSHYPSWIWGIMTPFYRCCPLLCFMSICTLPLSFQQPMSPFSKASVSSGHVHLDMPLWGSAQGVSLLGLTPRTKIRKREIPCEKRLITDPARYTATAWQQVACTLQRHNAGMMISRTTVPDSIIF